jgi:hypothetical protein
MQLVLEQVQVPVVFALVTVPALTVVERCLRTIGGWKNGDERLRFRSSVTYPLTWNRVRLTPAVSL